MKKINSKLSLSVDTCYETGQISECVKSEVICTNFSNYFNKTGLSVYDVRTSEGPPADHVIYLNKPEVMTAIGAQKSFVNCSTNVGQRFSSQGKFFFLYQR